MNMNTEKNIVSFNLAGWAWNLSNEPWEERLERACKCIKNEVPNAWLIGLSEVIPGTNEKYIEIIRQNFPNYVVVLPKAYYKNYRSAINVLLINKEGYEYHNYWTLDSLEDSLLYNYVGIMTEWGYFRVMNVHMPHTCNADKPVLYQKKREELRIAFEKSIKEDCKPYSRERDIQFILMGDLNSTPESDFVTKLAGNYNPTLLNPSLKENLIKPTWKNPKYDSKHIDYILYGRGIVKYSVITVNFNEIIETPIAEKISDHAIIHGKFKSNIDDSFICVL